MTLTEKLSLCIARDTGDGVHTSICGNHGLRFRNDFLGEVVESLVRGIAIYEAGLDTVSPAERFALAVLASQYRYRTGKEITEAA